jgi:hypothetical protein
VREEIIAELIKNLEQSVLNDKEQIVSCNFNAMFYSTFLNYAKKDEVEEKILPKI